MAVDRASRMLKKYCWGKQFSYFIIGQYIYDLREAFSIKSNQLFGLSDNLVELLDSFISYCYVHR